MFCCGFFNFRPREVTEIPPCTKNENQFHLISCVGEGSYGRVHLSLWKEHNSIRNLFKWKIVALKSVSKRRVVEKGHCIKIEHERQTLLRLNNLIDHKNKSNQSNESDIYIKKKRCSRSPFIVDFIGSFQNVHHLFFVLEWCPGGNLSELLDRQNKNRNHIIGGFHSQQRRGFSENTARFYLTEVLSALHHLHEHGIIYRDLKPENIVLDARGHIRLVDFGLAHIGEVITIPIHNQFKKHQSSSTSTVSSSSPTTSTYYETLYYTGHAYTICGSDDYIAPEILLRTQTQSKTHHKGNRLNNGYDWSSDLWSFGCLVYELLLGYSPFQVYNKQEKILKIMTQNGYRNSFSSKSSSSSSSRSSNHLHQNNGLFNQFHNIRHLNHQNNHQNNNNQHHHQHFLIHQNQNNSNDHKFDELSFASRDLITKLLMVDPIKRIGTSLYGWKSFYIDDDNYDDDCHCHHQHNSRKIDDDDDDDDDSFVCYGECNSSPRNTKSSNLDIEMMKDEKLRLTCGIKELRNHEFWNTFNTSNTQNDDKLWDPSYLMTKTPPYIPFPPPPKHHESHAKNMTIQRNNNNNNIDSNDDEEDNENAHMLKFNSSHQQNILITDTRYFSDRFTNQQPELPPLGHPHKGGVTPSFDGFLPLPDHSSKKNDDDDDDDASQKE